MKVELHQSLEAERKVQDKKFQEQQDEFCGKFDALENELSKVKEESKAKTAEITEMQHRIESLESELRKEKGENENLRDENVELDHKVEQLEADKNRNQRYINDLREEIARLKAHLKRLQDPDPKLAAPIAEAQANQQPQVVDVQAEQQAPPQVVQQAPPQAEVKKKMSWSKKLKREAHRIFG